MITRRLTRSLAPLLALAAFAAAPAVAGTFTVTLTNGTTFETRYRPTAAEWDEDIALIATDHGNWIALLKDEIADVTSSVEESGFGYQVDTTTLFVGWAPVELDEEEGDDKGGQGGGQGGQQVPIYTTAAEPSYSVEQFVSPGAVGGVQLTAPIVLTPDYGDAGQ